MQTIEFAGVGDLLNAVSGAIADRDARIATLEALLAERAHRDPDPALLATETLGQQIADAAALWSIEGDASGWGSDAAAAAWGDLLTLCARADAAEQLAVAVEWCDENGWTFTSERYNEYHEALAAWRALGEVQP